MKAQSGTKSNKVAFKAWDSSTRSKQQSEHLAAPLAGREVPALLASHVEAAEDGATRDWHPQSDPADRTAGRSQAIRLPSCSVNEKLVGNTPTG